MKKPALTKRTVLQETARRLFYKHGIRRVTVEEICREAGISKMTFYKHFKDKNDLGRCVILDIVEEVESRYEEIRGMDLPFPEKIKALMRLKVEQSKAMSWECLKDIQGGAFPELSELLNARQQNAVRVFLDDLAEAQKRGEVRSNLNGPAFLYIIERMQEWTADERLIRHFDSVEELTGEALDFLIYGLIGRPEPSRSRI
jgi:AcrR family transcriptional regulator